MRDGDNIMLFNAQVEGYLVFDMSDRITTHDEAYACTTTTKTDNIPNARSVFSLHQVEAGKNNIIKFGEKIRIQSSPFIYYKRLFLHSEQVSPNAYARMSRHQEVSFVTKDVYNTVWRILHLDPNQRVITQGQPVRAGDPIIIEHCATCHYLASD